MKQQTSTVVITIAVMGTIWLQMGTVPATAHPQRSPGPAKVGVGRADHLYLPGPVFAPPSVYPEGKIDYAVIEQLIARAVEAFAGQPADTFWSEMFAPSDRVAVMVDVQVPPVPIVLVEGIIAQLIEAGLQPENILIFAGDERDLFAAGFSLRKDRVGVKCYGAESVGYRQGISRIVLDMCDSVINIASLRPNSQLGMTGAIFNHLSCIAHSQRVSLQAQPQLIPTVAAEPIVRQRMQLHFLAALHPYYTVPTNAFPQPRWEYTGLLVSTDPVAVDMVGKHILEAERRQQAGQGWPLEPPPDYLQAAGEDHHLGQCHPDQITVVINGPRKDSFFEAAASCPGE